jgi:hypothetical protein
VSAIGHGTARQRPRFLKQIASYNYQPSLKQLAWLRSIVDQRRAGYAP